MSGRRFLSLLVVVVLAGCGTEEERAPEPAGTALAAEPADPGQSTAPSDGGPRGAVTLAFAGDTHFELHLAALLDRPRGALGPITRTLADADLTMVNLESAITERGTPEAKELEDPSQRFHFRTSPAALDALAAAGVDVVTMANNHGADYGPVGLRDTLRAIRNGPIPVVGIGRNRDEALAPYRVSIRGTDITFFAADASFREGASSVWAAEPTTPGVAAAHASRPRALLAAVRAASLRNDVVVVYLHWGEELQGCPTEQQRTTARALAAAGADIIVGTHAHVQLGSGWMGDTYVNYGLGNFLWYHDYQPESGVLGIRVEDGEVVGDSWTPARIGTDGRPDPLHGEQAEAAVRQWRAHRACADLTVRPDRLPAYSSSVNPIGPDLAERMRFSHRTSCPVPLRELRHLRMRYVGFDARMHTGEMVVHRDLAHDVTAVFHRLYDARWPIRRMRLVDDYRGDDALSMAANNTSGYNCRRVAGSNAWSTHAYGTAIDINPVQNPDLSGSSVAPSAGNRFARLDRSAAARVPKGVVHANDIVVRAFARVGWEWGGHWATGKDFQHFSASGR
jgi:poly-gamma-glutamate capsule biosynthesis protein CapA/YwtB (metallophosphatase superfamily)